MSVWDGLRCSCCGAPATVVFGGGSSGGDEVELAACEQCRDGVLVDVMRVAMGAGDE